MKSHTDSHYMRMALGLARRGCGSSWPNPTVGCVILDREGHVAGRGYTGSGGRPHGETIALDQAGAKAVGGTVYVTLEPCAHHGKTPPCAEKLVEAGVKRVVVATGDPDSRVSGKGLDILKKAGIEVAFGLCKDEADHLNEGFFKRITLKRPLITMKLATSLDGYIATASGQSKWITGPESRHRGHLLRANHDAIVVGIGTVTADNPTLDCRLPGLENKSPVRIVVDSRLSIPENCGLVEGAKALPTWIITTGNPSQKSEHLEKKGVKVFFCEPDAKGQIDLAKMMTLLANEGITRLLSEGGAQLNASLIRTSLLDRLYWFRSPIIIGGDGLAAIPSFGLSELTDAPQFTQVRSGRTGKDFWQEFKVGP